MSYFHIPSAQILRQKKMETPHLSALCRHVFSEDPALDYYVISFRKSAARFCPSVAYSVLDTVFPNAGAVRFLRSEADSVLDYFQWSTAPPLYNAVCPLPCSFAVRRLSAALLRRCAMSARCSTRRRAMFRERHIVAYISLSQSKLLVFGPFLCSERESTEGLSLSQSKLLVLAPL